MNVWLRLSATFHEHPKMLAVRKSAGARADSAELGWYRLLMASKRYGRWSFASEMHLEHVAGPYYRFVKLYRVEGLLDGLTIHDGETYNAIKTPAERKAEERERSRGGVTQQRDMPRDTNVTLDKRERIERVDTQNARDTTERDTSPRDPADIYWQLTGKYPSQRTLEWIDALTGTFGAEPVIAHLVAAHVADTSVSTLLGRTQDRLRSEARQLDQRERSEEEARLREKRAIPRPTEPWREEFRKAIQAQYDDIGGAA